ncbi:MAG: helix-hairpin-helix domain-containing protein [Chthoniobacterales bacterium]
MGQPANGLTTVENVTLVPTDWADGDSFRVRFPDGTEHTLRLYGADCVEWHVTDDSDARRLRAQRRYFGIEGYGDSARESIDLAKSLGEAAAAKVREILARPFRVDTAFADGRGDARFSRVYAFVTTPDGKDLATELVSLGLARAFGVYRSTPDGTSRGDYESSLKDAELIAAKTGLGVWKFTDWKNISNERMEQREEEIDSKIATGNAPPATLLDVNAASREELMQIPGVGETTANAIIEGRPFETLDDLLRVPGIGPATLEKMTPYVQAPGARPSN